MFFQIETKRTLIRPWSAANDREEFRSFTQDPEMMRYINFGNPWPESRVDDFFRRQQRNLENDGFCVGALQFKNDKPLRGIAGMQVLDKIKEVELAWWIDKPYWGKGYATETALGLVKYAFEIKGLPRVVAIAYLPNKASIRVMEKIGMRYEGTRVAADLAARHPEVEVAYYVLENKNPNAGK